MCVCDLGLDPGMTVVGFGIRLKFKYTPNITRRYDRLRNKVDCE